MQKRQAAELAHIARINQMLKERAEKEQQKQKERELDMIRQRVEAHKQAALRQPYVAPFTPQLPGMYVCMYDVCMYDVCMCVCLYDV